MSTSNKRLIIGSSLTAALGGFLFGFDTAVISGTIPFITKYFQLSHAMLGWAVSSALIGCIVGAVTIGKPGDIYGRKFMLKILAFLFFISALGTAFSQTLTQFVIFRLIGNFTGEAARPSGLDWSTGNSERDSDIFLYQLFSHQYRRR
jgi:MFS transporter, SP family, arabinose:H+ symporter